MKFLWQAKDVRISTTFIQPAFLLGERVLQTIAHVEENIRNYQEYGTLKLTNLRIVWHAPNYPALISIGYECITRLSRNKQDEPIAGKKSRVYIDGKTYSGESKEFIFSFQNRTDSFGMDLYESIQSLIKAYMSTCLYRSFKVNTCVTTCDGNSALLPHEDVVEQYKGVFRLAGYDGNKSMLGNLILTTVRLIWYSEITNSNVSIPHIIIASVQLAVSKNHENVASVRVTTGPESVFVMGFQSTQTKDIYFNLLKLFNAANSSPEYGVVVNFRNSPGEEAVQSDDNQTDVMKEELGIESENIFMDNLAKYESISGMHRSRSNRNQLPDPVYNKDLGLAVEQLKGNFTMADLWQIF